MAVGPVGWPRPRRGELLLLAVILLVAIALRLVYLAELKGAPDLEHPPVDGGFSLYWARALATGDWSLPPDAAGRDPQIRNLTYIRAPGYAYTLAGIHRLTDGAPLQIRGVQMAAGLLTVVLAWWLGRSIMGAAVGLAWAALLVLCWIPLYFEGGINENWLVVLLTLLLVLALRRSLARPDWRSALLVGALIGVGALVRGNFLLLLPAAVGWWWWALRRRGTGDRGPGITTLSKSEAKRS